MTRIKRHQAWLRRGVSYALHLLPPWIVEPSIFVNSIRFRDDPR
jgi:hypothetical protein